jgi:hypothetical protein
MVDKEDNENIKEQIAEEIATNFSDLQSVSGRWDGPSRQNAEDWAMDWLAKKEAVDLIEEQIKQKKESK